MKARRSMTLRYTLTLCVLLLVTDNAGAAGLYVGVGGGSAGAQDAQSNVDDGKSILVAASVLSTVTYDNTSPALAFVAGIEFNRYLAAEVAYTHLGTYKVHAGAVKGAVPGQAEETDNVNALSVAVVGRYPVYLDKIYALGKFGFADTGVDMSCKVPGATCLSATDSGVNPLYGIGVALRPVRILEIRVDYTIYPDVGNVKNDYTAGSFGLVETSVIYHF
jgi:hypothetical protein